MRHIDQQTEVKSMRLRWFQLNLVQRYTEKNYLKKTDKFRKTSICKWKSNVENPPTPTKPLLFSSNYSVYLNEMKKQRLCNPDCVNDIEKKQWKNYILMSFYQRWNEKHKIPYLQKRWHIIPAY